MGRLHGGKMVIVMKSDYSLEKTRKIVWKADQVAFVYESPPKNRSGSVTLYLDGEEAAFFDDEELEGLAFLAQQAAAFLRLPADEKDGF